MPNADLQNPIERVLKENRDKFAAVMSNPEKFRVQILYTQIDRDDENRPSFKGYSYRLQDDRYFYPASTVKFPAALLALEKLNDLNLENVNRDTWIRIDSSAAGQSTVWEDSTAPDGKPTIAHYIKKIFLVSDNDAYNRLFEFLGQEYLNEKLWEKGYEDVQILRRLESGIGAEGNRKTNGFLFYGGENIFYDQLPKENKKIWTIDKPDVRQGIGFMRGGQLVEEPIDFSNSNYLSLQTLHELLFAVFFPESLSPEKRFNLTPDDYRFLYRYMSMPPSKSDVAAYADSSRYYDSIVKFFPYGDSKKPIPGHMRIYNKGGQAYGYLIDNAYIVDLEAGAEFLLSAVLQVNENQIYNDDNYEYKEIGIPFLANLGREILELERQRERANRPDFSKLLQAEN